MTSAGEAWMDAGGSADDRWSNVGRPTATLIERASPHWGAAARQPSISSGKSRGADFSSLGMQLALVHAVHASPLSGFNRPARAEEALGTLSSWDFLVVQLSLTVLIRRPIHGAVFPPRSAIRQENLLADVATLCSRCRRPVYLFAPCSYFVRPGRSIAAAQNTSRGGCVWPPIS